MSVSIFAIYRKGIQKRKESNTRACEAECPKCVSISNIARLNREYLKAKLAD